MNIYEKYNLDKTDDVTVDTLPLKVEKSFYQIRKDYTNCNFDETYNRVKGYDELYINENGKLKHVATNPFSFSILLLFLKKYRPHPELLPKNLKHEYPFDDKPSEYIYKAMQLMLKPMNSFEEFKERLLLSTEKLFPYYKRTDISRFGDKLVFIDKKEEFGTTINIYGEVIPIAKETNTTYWERAILFDKEKKIFEYYVQKERTNYKSDMSHLGLVIKFYEEKYLYEYLLNKEIIAVNS